MTESTNTIKYIRDPNNLSKALVVCLWIFVAANILGIITNISIISVFNEILNGSIISDQKANEYDQRESFVTIFWLLSFLITGIIFLSGSIERMLIAKVLVRMI